MFNAGNTYTFSTYAPAILGQRYENVKVIAVGSYEIAAMIENVAVTHNNVLTYLGKDAEKDAQKLSYVIFVSGEGGKKKAMAIDWINPATVEEYQNLIGNFQIQISTQADMQRIRNMLAAAGYNKVRSEVFGANDPAVAG